MLNALTRLVIRKLSANLNSFVEMSGAHGTSRIDFILSASETGGVIAFDSAGRHVIAPDDIIEFYGGLKISRVNVACEIYAMCGNAAESLFDVGAIGYLPGCDRCAQKMSYARVN